MSRTTPTPSELVFRHVNSNAVLAAKTKKIVESLLDDMTRELAQPNLPPNRKGEIALACLEIFRALDSAIQNGSKLLVSPVRGAGHESKEPAPDVESILHELTKGKVARGSKP